MNARIIRTIIKKDLKEAAQNKGAVVPAVVIPLVFMVLLPLALILLPLYVPALRQGMLNPAGEFGEIQGYIDQFMGSELRGLDPIQTWIVLTTGYFMAPFMLIMPLMLSTIVGAESFVGERERKTIEALIYTPATDSELFMGKVLASVLPAVGLSWVSFLVYGVVVNAAAWPAMGRIWFPLANWWPLMLWLAPAIATLGMAVSVLISARVKTFMEAYQSSASLVVLVLGLVAGQATGMLSLSFGVVLLIGLFFWIVDAALIRVGIGLFSRSSLLTRL